MDATSYKGYGRRVQLLPQRIHRIPVGDYPVMMSRGTSRTGSPIPEEVAEEGHCANWLRDVVHDQESCLSTLCTKSRRSVSEEQSKHV